MLFRQLFDRVSCTYTYLIADEPSGEAVLIDPVFEQHERDTALIRELGVTLKYTLDTHVHADHVTAAWLLKQTLGSEIVLSKRYGAEHVDRPVDHGDVLSFGELALEVRATPGHTSGCLTYVLGSHGRAFTGDALLIRGAGRTDFQGGNAQVLYKSIKDQIFSLPATCALFPGHDYRGRTMTTVAEEQAFNARIGGKANEGDFVGFMNNLGLAHPKRIDIAVPANMICGRPEVDEMPPASDWGPVLMTYAGIPRVDPEWVATHRDQVHVLDVRQQEECGNGVIPGAICVELDQVRERASELPADRPIVTVCRSGTRSGQAAVILKQAGFTQVANVVGGMLEWEELSLPLSAPK